MLTAQAWEFKHPEFQANKKDSLDNIRRKAPAPRKTNTAPEDSIPAQQLDLLNSQLVATQHQLQNLQNRYDEMAGGHVTLIQQVTQLQRTLRNHDGAMNRLLGFLHDLDSDRRSGRTASFANGQVGMSDLVNNRPNGLPASPLQQASRLLAEFPAESWSGKDLEQMQAALHFRSGLSTPSNEHASNAGVDHTPTSAAPVAATAMPYPARHHYDLDSMVYPVGQVNGIDPINSEHINNIPYSIPPSGSLAPEAPAEAERSKSAEERKKSATDPWWGMHKPRILLVEDDKTCARVGSKFLRSFKCGVEIAVRSEASVIAQS